ncbi:PREDICTED: ubiquitin-conjugating enzyme E2 variant 3 [Nanorana parkeri]|uniref:ubiquitin-conjugating enzyme E2 variant 3 n=1 Tax=Nanorana parkeri TaxID=125878 RepID=UPI000854CA4D|nr:PREDICTED: ubiquitin-conjugating enzyme E2 variant 3 [Nanorana parkeri]
MSGGSSLSGFPVFGGSRKESEMERSVDVIRQRLGKYKFRDLTVEELKDVYKVLPGFIYSMDTYTFKDGSQKDLLNLSGTVPMKFQGNSYNIPICLWLLDSHPFAPPMCFLKPTDTMGVRVGKHIDAQGRIYLPYLQNWSHPKSTILGLIKEMVSKFEEELPLYSLTATDADKQRELLSYISQVTDGVSNLDVSFPSRGKVTVIGGGDLALACLLAISAKRAADNLVLLDVSDGGLKAMDLDIFCIPNVQISKDLSTATGSKAVIITVNAWSNAQSYLEVLQSNVDLLRGIVPAVAYHCPDSVIVIASQPVEIMTYVAWKLSGLPHRQVVGIGCNLDSVRFQHIIRTVTNSQEEAQDGWIIGEQGENKVAAWNDEDAANNQKPPGKIYPKIFQEQLANRALEVMKGKGQRSWSIGLSVAELTDTIAQNKKRTHSVSTFTKGFYNIQEEVFLSLPCVLGSTGVYGNPQILQLDDAVTAALQKSASSIQNLQQQLKL